MKCTWMMEPKPTPEDEEPEPYPCDRTAIVVYHIDNEKKRSPTEPARFSYPRCSLHDTPLARKTAEKDGYEVEDLT